MFQAQVHSLRHVTTAHLAQTMTLLSLPVDELMEQIQGEIASNPALELVEERRCPRCRRLLDHPGPCPVCSKPQNESIEEPVVYVSPRDDFYTHREPMEDNGPEDSFSPATEDLPTYVLRQIAPELEKNDRKLAAYLLTHLDEDGLLTIQPVEAAMYLHIPISMVEKVQKIIQHADPVGVGSCTTREALLVQLEVLAESRPVPELASRIVNEGMDLLSRHQYSELAHRLSAPVRLVQKASEFISENLNPFPARSHWGDSRQPGPANNQVYRQPDILISFLNENKSNRLVVEIISPIGGTLRVNPLYKQALTQTTEGVKEEMKTDMERASLFVKCLQQRNHTMERLMYKLVTLQRDFIINGEKSLKSVTRASISQELDVHESTISRAVANKSVQLPNRRIVPLSSFFDRSLNVRTVLKDIIGSEAKPLSDSELVDRLADNGYQVARRTVAKYRAMEGILPAHLRHTATAG